RYAQCDLLGVILPGSCGLCFLDSTGFDILWSRIVFSLNELSKLSVPDQNFNGMLKLDSVFS
ncbi:hypothetical protein A2U01_0106093, partial [Trifolium medium]|nr:hypothetical protein [Trifolium medium]